MKKILPLSSNSIGNSFAINYIVLAVVNSIVNIMQGFTHFHATLNLVIKLLAESSLAMLVGEVAVGRSMLSNIPFL